MAGVLLRDSPAAAAAATPAGTAADRPSAAAAAATGTGTAAGRLAAAAAAATAAGGPAGSRGAGWTFALLVCFCLRDRTPGRLVPCTRSWPCSESPVLV